MGFLLSQATYRYTFLFLDADSGTAGTLGYAHAKSALRYTHQGFTTKLAFSRSGASATADSLPPVHNAQGAADTPAAIDAAAIIVECAADTTAAIEVAAIMFVWLPTLPLAVGMVQALTQSRGRSRASRGDALALLHGRAQEVSHGPCDAPRQPFPPVVALCPSPQPLSMHFLAVPFPCHSPWL